jgi:hypothetical protein
VAICMQRGTCMGRRDRHIDECVSLEANLFSVILVTFYLQRHSTWLLEQPATARS